MQKEIPLEELKNIELDILIYIDKICKKHNLNYYLFGGTLLGAVKYKGFIPWDDDIDIALFREDYNKLINILKNDEKYKLFSVYNCKNYYYPFSKLSDQNTLLFENAKEIEGLGVNIDIFPIDGYLKINDTKFLKVIKNLTFRRYKMNNGETRKNNFKDVIYSLFDNLTLCFGYNFYAKVLDYLTSCCKIKKYVGVRCFNYKINEVFRYSELKDTTLFEFESYKFKGFKNYDLYLKKQFGEYHLDPPIEKQKTHHSFKAYYK